MGNRFSQTVCAEVDKQKSASDYLDDKLAEVIKNKAQRQESKASSFNKLLLRFSSLNKGFLKCREVFHSLDADGNNVVDLEELRLGCAKLGFDVSDDLVIKIFDASDLDGNRVVDFREFIVVLAILYMFSTENGSDPPPGLDKAIVKTFSLAEEAFCYFDSSRDGYMDRSEVLSALKETGVPGKRGQGQKRSSTMSESSSNNSTIAKRFEEMDWDNNGQISFKEFLYAVQGWVLDEDDDEVQQDSDDDAQQEAAAKAAAFQRLTGTKEASDGQGYTRRSSLKTTH
jgi:calcium-binding protein CML